MHVIYLAVRVVAKSRPALKSSTLIGSPATPSWSCSRSARPRSTIACRIRETIGCPPAGFAAT